MKMISKAVLLAALFGVLSFSAGAQTKKNAKPTPTPAPVEEILLKRNERPAEASGQSTLPAAAASTHFYEFSRPGFSYSKIEIRHDDNGRGTITFQKDGHDESLTDPIELSKATLGKISDTLNALKYLDSAEEYQHPRDYSHMGNVTFTLRRDGRTRTVKFNWTDNPSAKALMDEYRRISNEYTWKFEITLSRENMPLQSPGLMDALDAYIKRNEISDPPHLLPFLAQLSTDERLPLMARNRATKLMKEIEKAKK
jgi:hypothetical protein